MKRFLRYVAYRELYRSLRKALNSSEASDEESTARRSSNDGSTVAAQREMIESNPHIPTEGSTVDTPAQLKAVLQQMDPYEFEHFVADLWERMGWETDVSTASADKGVDITARKSSPYEQLLLIQAKRYGPNTTVGSPDVQQYASLRQQFENVDKVLIVTTNSYSRQARDIAEDLNVKLIDGDGLVELIDEHDSLDMVAEYLDFIEPAEQSDQDDPELSDNEPTDETEVPSNPDESSTDSRSGQLEAAPSTRWRNVILGASLGWLLVFFGVTAVPEGLWAVLFVGTWLGLPMAIYLDTRTVAAYTEWPKYRWLYIASSLVWVVAVVPGLIYLWRRRSAVDAGN